MFTSAERAHVVHALMTHAALPLLLEGLFLEDVRLAFSSLLTEGHREIRSAQLKPTEPTLFHH